MAADGSLRPADASAGCTGCAASPGCGARLLRAPALSRPRRVPAVAGLPAPGDQLLVSVTPGVLLWGAVAAYFVPALLLLVGAVVGSMADHADTELWAIAGGLGGLALGCIGLSLYDRGWEKRLWVSRIRPEDIVAGR